MRKACDISFEMNILWTLHSISCSEKKREEEKTFFRSSCELYFLKNAEDKGEYDGNDDEPKDFGKARRTGEGGKRSTDSCKGGFGSWK